MDSLHAYSIPLIGRKDGMHQFDFQIDTDFFSHFPESPITEGAFKVQVNLDKKPNVIDVQVDFEGTMLVPCDRCLEPMHLPLASLDRLVIKYSEDAKEDTDEVVYLSFETGEWNVAKYIYEFICLAIPLIKTHDLVEGASCDEKMISYLDQQTDNSSEEIDNPIWDQLKNIKLK